MQHIVQPAQPLVLASESIARLDRIVALGAQPLVLRARSIMEVADEIDLVLQRGHLSASVLDLGPQFIVLGSRTNFAAILERLHREFVPTTSFISKPVNLSQLLVIHPIGAFPP